MMVDVIKWRLPSSLCYCLLLLRLVMKGRHQSGGLDKRFPAVVNSAAKRLCSRIVANLTPREAEKCLEAKIGYPISATALLDRACAHNAAFRGTVSYQDNFLVPSFCCCYS
jgi:hypothetical protein